jgi:hypothetical protein
MRLSSEFLGNRVSAPALTLVQNGTELTTTAMRHGVKKARLGRYVHEKFAWFELSPFLVLPDLPDLPAVPVLLVLLVLLVRFPPSSSLYPCFIMSCSHCEWVTSTCCALTLDVCSFSMQAS